MSAPGAIANCARRSLDSRRRTASGTAVSVQATSWNQACTGDSGMWIGFELRVFANGHARRQRHWQRHSGGGTTHQQHVVALRALGHE